MTEKDETSYNTKNKVMKFGILITARNNEYSMVEEWIGLYDYSGISILNLDLNSDEELRLKGKKICKKHGIVFL